LQKIKKMNYSLPIYKFGDKIKEKYQNVGNWVKDNKQGVIGGLEVAGGTALSLSGIGAPIGSKLIQSGLDNISSEIENDEYTASLEEQQALGNQKQNEYLSQIQELQNLLDQQQETNEDNNIDQSNKSVKKRIDINAIRTSNINQRIQGEATPRRYSFGCGGKLVHNYVTGGPIINNYEKGQFHSGPNGGIPVDINGTPSILNKTRPVGLTENKEITYNGYVFSNSIPYKKEK